MKIKNILIGCLVVHLVCILIINIHPFHTLKHTENVGDLSSIGKVCVDQIGSLELPKPMIHGIDFIANLTGSDRGYEFFSPNISRKNLQLTFVSDQGKALSMLTSLESEMKMFTAISYVNKRVGDQELWHSTLQSICQLFFIRNPNIQVIEVYATLSSFPEMPVELKPHAKTITETVLLSKVQRYENKL